MATQDCIFCKIVAGEIPAQVIDQDERTITFLDIAPANRGHMLVVPKRHADDLLATPPDELAAVALAAQKAAHRAMEKLGADGVNVLNSCRPAAWQTVFHLHFHVIPRFLGDPLRLPWVPETADPDQLALAAEALR